MIVESDFRPPYWLRNPHLQTLLPYLARQRARPTVRRERLELADGDFIDLDWTCGSGGPVVIVLHGLSGSVDSHYARTILSVLHRRGMRGVLMNFRGASGEPNRLPRTYHGGETSDLSLLVRALRAREPHTPLAMVGYSLGGNVLLKWLGEQGDEAPLRAAVAVSVPFELHRATDRLMQGFSRVYQWHILRCLKRSLAVKARTVELPFDISILEDIATFRRFDDVITAPLHGFRDADDYYRRASARRYLTDIRIPTLIVHALDDPFVPASALPGPQELSAATVLEVARHGGHVGFVSGRPISGRWLERRVMAFLSAHLASAAVGASRGRKKAAAGA